MQKLERYKKRAAALLLASVVSAGFVAGVSGCRTPAAVPQHISVWAPAQVGHYRNLSLTPGGTVHEMRFTWQSLSPTGSIRLYHAGAGNPVQTISSQTQSLDTRVADTVFFPGEGGLYTVHHVTLTGLRPGAAYEYVVVGEGFTSARKPFRSGTAGSSFSFFLGGDPQIGMGDQVGGVGMVGISEQGALFSAELDRGGWLNTMETALAHTPDAAFFLALGDQIHTRNHNELNPHAWAQSQFMHDIMFAPVQFHSLPIVPVVGNHDGSGSNNVNHQLWHSHYNTPFDAPNIRRHSVTEIEAPPGGGLTIQQMIPIVMAYTGVDEATAAIMAADFGVVADTSVGRTIYTQFDYYMIWGNTLFIVLDSNTRSWPAGRLQWLEDVIAAYPDVDWRVGVLHHSPYSAYRPSGHSEKVQIITNVLPELERLGIDIVLGGHCHVYSRSHPMIANTPIRDQRWLDAWGNIQSDPTGMMYNAVLDPQGIIYVSFNSASGSGFYNVNSIAQRDYLASFNQNFRRNFSVATVTHNTFTVATYQVNGGMFGGGAITPTTLVDVITIVRGDAQGNVPADVVSLRQRGGAADADALIGVENPPALTLSLAATLADLAGALPATVAIATETHSNDERGHFAAVRFPTATLEPGFYGRDTRPLMAEVQWDTSGVTLTPGTAQIFTISGNVTLPRGVTDPGGLASTVFITVIRQ